MLRAALIPGEVVNESGAVGAHFPLAHTRPFILTGRQWGGREAKFIMELHLFCGEDSLSWDSC